jgi:hypothetical protein
VVTTANARVGRSEPLSIGGGGTSGDSRRDAAIITRLWEDRSAFYSDEHKKMNELVDVYNGILPVEFKDYFHEDMHLHIPNMVRLAWDDLTAMSGKVFPLFVRPDRESATAKGRAELQEMIGYGYNDAGRRVGAAPMDLLMKTFMWWIVGCANAVGMVLPDFEHQTPYFTFRDPRTHYPPVGWSPYTQAKPSDALFAYQLSLGEIKARYPESAGALDAMYSKMISGPTLTSGLQDSSLVWVGEYYTEDTWQILALEEGVVLLRSDTGDPGHPDVNPVVPMALYSPLGAKGRSIFSDQVSIQAAMARMFSQKLDFYDRTLYPLIFHTPVAGNRIKMGPFSTTEYKVTAGEIPKVDVVGPAHSIDADQAMQFVIGLSRMLNRNPEMMQGAGQADSAKALNELRTGITATVRDMLWPPVLAALPKLYEAAAKIDLKLWKYTRKPAYGTRKNTSFRINYVPATALVGRESDFEVDPGLGLAGYQGTLEILQMLGAEMISEDQALEQLEHVKEPQAEKRRIFSDRVHKVMFAELAAKAQQMALVPGALAELDSRVTNGEDPYMVLQDMEKSGRMTAPPPGMPPGMPGAAPGGIPPELAAALQGGPPGAAGAQGPVVPLGPGAPHVRPTLAAIRGGP